MTHRQSRFTRPAYFKWGAAAIAIPIGSHFCQAQFLYGGFSDVRPYVLGNALSTDAHDDSTGTNVPSVRVFQYRFQNDPNDPYFTQDPGFNALTGNLPGGSFLSFDVLSSLTYWSGSGSFALTAPPAGESLQLDFGANDRYITANSGSMSGFTIGNVASNGSLHKHLNAFLLASDGNADPTDGVVASPGIYFTSLRLNTGSGVASSPPIFLVYANGVSGAAFNQAVEAVRDASAPNTNLANAISNWTATGSGSWETGSNWDGGVPDAVSLQASFGGSSASTVSIATQHAIGTINFSNAPYTLAGPGTINLQMYAGASAGINVTAGSQTITAPVLASSNLIVTTAANASLTISSDMTFVAGAGLTKNGDGKLAVKNLRAGAVQVNAGAGTTSLLQILPNGTSSGTSKITSLSVASGSALDLTNNSLIVDYTGSSPLSSLTALVASGYASGSWKGSGINSSTAASGGTHPLAIGIGEAAALGLSTFGGQAVDTTSVLLKTTYAGDANLDGKVDIADLGLLATNYGKSGSWTGGDFNYDGVVNIADLGVLATNYGLNASPGSLSWNQSLQQFPQLESSLPEPSIGAGLLAASALLRIRRKRNYHFELMIKSTLRGKKMRFNYPIFVAAVTPLLSTAIALADFDVSPYVSSGKILTGGYEDDSDTFISNVRVLDFGFDQTPVDTGNNTYFTQDPGFHPAPNTSGFGSGDSIVVTPVSVLSYYGGDGSGSISFTPVTGGTSLTYGYGSQRASINGGAYSGSINLGHTDPNGEFDNHLEATLAGGGGAIAPDGLYLLQLQVSDPTSSYIASAPAYILYSVNDDDAVDPAKEYLRDTYAPGTNLTPEPSSVSLLGLVAAGMLRRRRCNS